MFKTEKSFLNLTKKEITAALANANCHKITKTIYLPTIDAKASISIDHTGLVIDYDKDNQVIFTYAGDLDDSIDVFLERIKLSQQRNCEYI